MKLSLFLSVLFIFTLFHFSKASPLRLQKRAAFYIANETACVVDNIVYSNGEPIPTDDPCESCKCRPPGFACVLENCKVKPGCKAVRRIGQCCPEYICDLPEGNNFFGGNVLPSANLLPVLNDESVLPGEIFPNQSPEPSQRPADPTQPPTPSNSNEPIATTESKQSAEKVDQSPTTESAILTTEDSKTDSSVEERKSSSEKLSIEEKPTSEEKEDISKDISEGEEKKADVSEEIKSLFNSETEIKKKGSEGSTEVKIDPTQLSVGESASQTIQTVSSEIPEVVTEAKVTEKSGDESIVTETDTEKTIKNSAAENSKSLKLSDDQPEDTEKKQEIQVGESERTEETLKPETDPKSIASSEIPSVTEQSSTTESKPESRENLPEETPLDPKASSVSSTDKIESVETVTVVVNEIDKAESTTEGKLVTEIEVSELSTTRVTEENLLKSNVLKESERSAEIAEAETESTGKNFEIFPSSIDTSKVTSTTDSPSTEKEIKVKADKSESTTLEAIKENVSEAEKEDSLVATTTQSAKEDADVSKGARANEEIGEPKKDEPTIAVIRISPNAPIKIQIITDPVATTKTEEQPAKDLGTTETINETKSEENTEIKDETKEEAKVTEAIPEVREEPEKETVAEKLEEIKPESSENVEKNKEEPSDKVEEIKAESSDKVEEIKAKSSDKEAEIKAESSEKEKVGESSSTEKLEESSSTEKVEESPATRKLEESPITEKVEESPITEKVEESPATENIEKLESTEKSEVATPETSIKVEERAEEPEVLGSTTQKVEIAATEKSNIEVSTSVTDQVTRESNPTDASKISK